MNRREDHQALIRDLTALGADPMLAEVPDDLTDRVMARIPSGQPTESGRAVPDRRGAVHELFVSRRRVLVLGLIGLLLGLLATPPVRAAVAELFGFGAVRVGISATPGPSATIGTAPVPPPITGSPQSVAQAAQRVDFPLVVPEALPTPDGVQVSGDRRVVSMTWDLPGGRLRLDQIGAGLDYAFAKTAAGVEFTTVDGALALWFATPHEVVVLAPDGTPQTEPPRLAGSTLIWTRGTTTVRLEGPLALEPAREIARSVRPAR